MGDYLQIHGTKGPHQGKAEALLQLEPGARELMYAEVLTNRHACIEPDEALICVVQNPVNSAWGVPAMDACCIMTHFEWTHFDTDIKADRRPMRFVAIKKTSARIPDTVRKELP